MADNRYGASLQDEEAYSYSRAAAYNANRTSPQRMRIECASCRDDITSSDRVTFVGCDHHVCPECACLKVLPLDVPVCPLLRCSRAVCHILFHSAAKDRTREASVVRRRGGGAEDGAGESSSKPFWEAGGESPPRGEEDEDCRGKGRCVPREVETSNGAEYLYVYPEAANAHAEAEAEAKALRVEDDEKDGDEEDDERDEGSASSRESLGDDEPSAAATVAKFEMAAVAPPERSFLEERWHKRCVQLRHWLDRPDGDGLLPHKSDKDCDQSLRYWVTRQKYLYANYVEGLRDATQRPEIRKLWKGRKEMLDKLGFEEWWEYSKITRTQAYVLRANAVNKSTSLAGNADSGPAAATATESSDGRTKVAKAIKAVPAESQKINFREEMWEKRFRELEEYKRTNGKVHIGGGERKKHPELNPLYHWCVTQRKGYVSLCHQAKTGTKEKKAVSYASLTKRKVDRLNSIGFKWALKDDKDAGWEKRYEQLLEYKRVHGNCLVPYKYPGLGYWVDGLRKSYRRGKRTRTLTDERIARLESIGFVWQTKFRSCFKKSDLT
uniref:Helicase-associated domain-containing protein n=1 Tax=Odontella aurita TaxID=265563 RepID=A0A7S4JV38_9STRA